MKMASQKATVFHFQYVRLLNALECQSTLKSFVRQREYQIVTLVVSAFDEFSPSLLSNEYLLSDQR